MAETIATTPRLLVRRFRDSDLGSWLEHMNTPAVRAHIGGVDSADECAARFARQKGSWTDEAGGWLVIERRADGEMIGGCGFGPITCEAAPAEMRGVPEIGWSLREDCWGQGYATEAASALLPVVFERIGLPLIFSQTSEANRGSWRVMERLGMERRPELDYEDPDYPPEENPTKVYRLRREDWQALRDG